MSRIIVAGAGHGGLVAAIKLAASGHEVTVYDKQKKGEYYLDQRDSFEAGSMEYAGIDIPEHYRAKSNSLTFVPIGDETPALTLPAKEGSETLTVERKELHEYLINLAE
ncbi:MAG: NAD(P)-binding protein, partial [Clostridia bacterium]|nr:NAD(P)-binding protein [Clostridia bacterium]